MAGLAGAELRHSISWWHWDVVGVRLSCCCGGTSVLPGCHLGPKAGVVASTHSCPAAQARGESTGSCWDHTGAHGCSARAGRTCSACTAGTACPAPGPREAALGLGCGVCLELLKERATLGHVFSHEFVGKEFKMGIIFSPLLAGLSVQKLGWFHQQFLVQVLGKSGQAPRSAAGPVALRSPPLPWVPSQECNLLKAFSKGRGAPEGPGQPGLGGPA